MGSVLRLWGGSRSPCCLLGCCIGSLGLLKAEPCGGAQGLCHEERAGCAQQAPLQRQKVPVPRDHMKPCAWAGSVLSRGSQAASTGSRHSRQHTGAGTGVGTCVTCSYLVTV